MKPLPAHSALRLVGSGVAPVQRPLTRGHTPSGRVVSATYTAAAPAFTGPTPERRRQIEAENRAASMSALDPRWALAVRANSMLQGGRAAILPPESRRFLVSLGKDLNLRVFDANLIIAIVQDAARAGADPLGPEAKMRLKLVPEPAANTDRPALRMLIGATLMGGLLAWFLIRAFGH